jgi:hypothetical protein
MRLASKQSRFQHVLTMVHPAVARLAKNVASRETPRTSMMDLAVRIATILQKAIETSGTSPDTLVASVRNKIVEIADWAAATGNEWKALPTLDEMALAARQWHEDLAARIDDKAQYKTDDTVVMEFPDGWKIVELHPDNCEAEGKIMGHCVSGYADYVRDKLDRIFSLRDPNNRPHVTFNTTKRDTSDDAETWDEDSEWYWSKERALEARHEDWEDLVGPRARGRAAEEVKEQLSATHPPSLFDETGLEEMAESMVAKKIADQKAEYEEKWGPVLNVDEYNVGWNHDDSYGDEHHIEMWAEKDYEQRESEYEEPTYDWHIDQIQGKEDSAPLDKYRPYLYQFLTELDHPTDDVEGRMLPIDRMIERLDEAPGRFGGYVQELREVDQGRLYDYMIQKYLVADPDDDRYNDEWKIANYVKRKIEMGSATPEHEAMVRRLFEREDTGVIIGTSLFEVVRGGREWVIDRLLKETNPFRLCWYVGLMTPKGFFKDENLRTATIRKLELAFQQVRSAGDELPAGMLESYLTLLGREGAERNIEKIIAMENYDYEDDLKKKQQYTYRNITPITEGTAAALADIYVEDPGRWRQLLRSIHPGLREIMIGHHSKLNLVEPKEERNEMDAKFPGFEEDETEWMLANLGSNSPSWSMNGTEHMRSNQALVEEREREKNAKEPGQMQLFASITRLAEKLEEVSPLMADRLEALL